MRVSLTIDTDVPGDVAKAQELLSRLTNGTNGHAPAEAKCPTHNFAKPSTKGGFYCPRKLPDGTFCTWKAG